MSLLELSWAAGFFDGEGHTGYRKPLITPKTSRRLIVEVSQNNKLPLERFKLAVGSGKVYGPYTSSKMFQYQISGPKAVEVLEKLWPYLGPTKRIQADKAIILYENTYKKSRYNC